MIRSENGQRIIRELPLNRILTETDGPFAKHDNQPATPSTVSLVIDHLANMFNMESDEVRAVVKKTRKACCGNRGRFARELTGGLAR
ncbi:TatD family hydrolase [Planctomicrobium sp. SH527]|uniref:TatD family hydrolase n=1 Tax=Planctomicrobium sp. SH527 TaxID=3448123 RepID=UPI003F5B5178